MILNGDGLTNIFERYGRLLLFLLKNKSHVLRITIIIILINKVNVTN